MQAVADEAGITAQPVVYACFDSKDDLFRSLLAREEQRIVGEIQGAFSNADLSDPERPWSRGSPASSERWATRRRSTG